MSGTVTIDFAMNLIYILPMIMSVVYKGSFIFTATYIIFKNWLLQENKC